MERILSYQLSAISNWQLVHRTVMAECFLATCDCNETRPLLWQERVRGDLAVELCRPAAGNRRGTGWTTAVRGQAVIFDQVAAAPDQRLAALRAARVLPISDHAGKIASVDIAQARPLADLRGSQQVFGVRIARDIVLHFVVAVKCGDV